DFRGFNGVLQAKVVRRDEQLWELTVEVTKIISAPNKDRSKNPQSIIGKPVMLSGFWNKKDAYHSIAVGDVIQATVEHPQRLGDQLSVTEDVRKLNK
ncbi:hypothetical protein OAF09_01785, partial [bacterium]|nr:hypothetical protein [bacterium]